LVCTGDLIDEGHYGDVLGLLRTLRVSAETPGFTDLAGIHETEFIEHSISQEGA
jgi:hypothetical protein